MRPFSEKRVDNRRTSAGQVLQLVSLARREDDKTRFRRLPAHEQNMGSACSVWSCSFPRRQTPDPLASWIRWRPTRRPAALWSRRRCLGWQGSRRLRSRRSGRLAEGVGGLGGWLGELGVGRVGGIEGLEAEGARAHFRERLPLNADSSIRSEIWGNLPEAALCNVKRNLFGGGAQFNMCLAITTSTMVELSDHTNFPLATRLINFPWPQVILTGAWHLPARILWCV